MKISCRLRFKRHDWESIPAHEGEIDSPGKVCLGCGLVKLIEPRWTVVVKEDARQKRAKEQYLTYWHRENIQKLGGYPVKPHPYIKRPSKPPPPLYAPPKPNNALDRSPMSTGEQQKSFTHKGTKPQGKRPTGR